MSYQEKLDFAPGDFAPGAEGLTFQCGDAVECHAEPPTCKCIQQETTSSLVTEFAELKVWFAVNETNGRTLEGNSKHSRLCEVVMELRARRVLD